jgi:hypothetical protein
MIFYMLVNRYISECVYECIDCTMVKKRNLPLALNITYREDNKYMLYYLVLLWLILIIVY